MAALPAIKPPFLAALQNLRNGPVEDGKPFRPRVSAEHRIMRGQARAALVWGVP